MERHDGLVGKIATIEDFNRIQGRADAFVVVTNYDSPNVVHRPSCSLVNMRQFKMKVIDNKGKNGQYFYVSNMASVEVQME